MNTTHVCTYLGTYMTTQNPHSNNKRSPTTSLSLNYGNSNPNSHPPPISLYLISHIDQSRHKPLKNIHMPSQKSLRGEKDAAARNELAKLASSCTNDKTTAEKRKNHLRRRRPTNQRLPSHFAFANANSMKKLFFSPNRTNEEPPRVFFFARLLSR